MIDNKRQSAKTVSLCQTLAQEQYAAIPFDLSPSEIQEAMSTFMQFLSLPDSIKENINFSIAPKHRRGDVGYKHRDADDHIYNDAKDFFHFHPAIMTKYKSFIDEQPIVKSFLTHAVKIWQLVYKKTEQLFDEIEQEYPGSKDRIFATKDVHILLRFLKYEWQTSGEYLAKPHYDSGSFTLAIAESCPGLRIGSGPDDLKIVPHSDNTALFFVSSNFEKILGKAHLKPTWHDVKQLDETLIGKPFARWALVAFIEGHGIKALPRAQTHKWYTAQT